MARALQGLGYVVFMIMVVVMAGEVSGNWRVMGDDDCGGAFGNLITECQQYVGIPGPKTDPSSGCCDAIQKADVPCVCAHITPEVEKIISMEKVTYVAQKCGRALSPGTKCGSYTVPPKI
ncbi:Bifunctional inhibitor/lipid-transfer protein/seed storage 2S albumin protein [Dioscorea alata]|uniref:Bifunctional inhibitor/lipid-transfer protein/seed storage 2S albumin protein n=1 Tax=Dioscorea alata TaxID=55571 RepID=A0ACB7VXD1_DIOAL|nr:Bifunctional inhibitor/lipid-transfer protein/seed storage 2S albumin protein [Dioscorea alata]